MIETYTSALFELFGESLPKKSNNEEWRVDLKRVMQSFRESVSYMQTLCDETGLSVTQGKRVQRQVRYDKLKEEFSRLAQTLLQQGNGCKALKEAEVDRIDSVRKIKLYKD